MVQIHNVNPRIKWDGKMISVTLPMENGEMMEAKWNSTVTFVIRVREAGAGEWSFGFETPITGCTFVDLKPDTEYEVQVTSKNSTGEGEPVYAKIRTNPEGGSENIIPFRKR